MSGNAKLVIASGVICLILAMGIRQSFGIFLTPIAIDLQVGRQVFGLAIALQNLLWGLAQPFSGAIADKFGAAWVMIAGGVIYALGVGLAAFATDPLELNFTLGVLVGLALAGTTYGTVLGAVGRVVPPEKRSLAFGACTAAGSFGMFAVVPGAQALLDAFAWRDAFIVLAIAISLLVPLAFGFPGERSADRHRLRRADDHGRARRGADALRLLAAQCRFLRLRLPRRLRRHPPPGVPRRPRLVAIGQRLVAGHDRPVQHLRQLPVRRARRPLTGRSGCWPPSIWRAPWSSRCSC